MGKRTEQKKETLERLRNVIDELVAQKGFDAVTIREISERAGVSTGVFYYYFHSKDDILFDRYVRASTRWNDEEARLDAMPPREALRYILEDGIHYTLTRVPSVSLPYHKAILSEYSKWAQDYPDMNRCLMRKYFSRAQELGQLVPSSYTPEQLADMLWSMNYGMRFCMHLDGFSFSEQANIPQQLRDWLDSQFVD